MIDDQVAEFHRVMGIESRTTPGLPDERTMRLRLRLVMEEAFELLAASVSRGDAEYVASLLHDTFRAIDGAMLEPDLVEVADALADLDYVVAGTRLALGIPGQAVADEVHRANMAKAPGGVVLRDGRGKVRKPPGWTPPDVAAVLERHGRRR